MSARDVEEVVYGFSGCSRGSLESFWIGCVKFSWVVLNVEEVVSGFQVVLEVDFETGWIGCVGLSWVVLDDECKKC